MIHVIKWTRSIFPLCFCILQAVKKWTVGRPRNKANINAHMSYTSLMEGSPLHHSECSNAIENGVVKCLSRTAARMYTDTSSGSWLPAWSMTL